MNGSYMATGFQNGSVAGLSSAMERVAGAWSIVTSKEGVEQLCAEGSQAPCGNASFICSRVDPNTGLGIGNPSKRPGEISFDNIGFALLTVFQCFTLEGWADIMYDLELVGSPVSAIVFFVCVVVFCSMFLLNLALAVIVTEYVNAIESRLLRDEEALKKREVDYTEAPSTPASPTLSDSRSPAPLAAHDVANGESSATLMASPSPLVRARSLLRAQSGLGAAAGGRTRARSKGEIPGMPGNAFRARRFPAVPGPSGRWSCWSTVQCRVGALTRSAAFTYGTLLVIVLNTLVRLVLIDS